MTWTLLGPLLSAAGILVGLGVGWGVVKSTVKDLQDAVSELAKISRDVTVLQTQHIHSSANLENLLERVHSIELTLARANLGG